MGNRYIITGAQLGMIKATCKDPHTITEIHNILENQYLCYADNTSVYDDIRKIREKINKEEDDGK